MRALLMCGAAALLLAAFGACADLGDSAESARPQLIEAHVTFGACEDGRERTDGIEIQLLALDSGAISKMAYEITVNKAKYVVISSNESAPPMVGCVASCDDGGLNTITVKVTKVEFADGRSLPDDELPALQKKDGVPCKRGELTTVKFEYQGLRLPSFDIDLGTNLIHCAAKLDCKTTGDDLSFFPTGTAEGLVLGLACAASSGTAPTVLHMDDIEITCGGGAIVINPDHDGALPAAMISGSWANEVAGVVVSRGGSSGTLYWNATMGLNEGMQLKSCVLSTKATATPGDAVPLNSAYIDFSVAVGDTCTSTTLFANDGQIKSAWPASGTAHTFDHSWSPP